MGMAHKVKPVAVTPAVSSLQRLKTLENDHPSFTAQLEEVARILGEPHILKTPFEQNNNALQFTGKADWTLRWITKKLGLDDIAGVQARGSVPAWNMLGNIVRILSVASSTQTLKANHFLHSLEKALTESTSPPNEASNGGHTRHGAKRRKVSPAHNEGTSGGRLVGSIARCLVILTDLARTAEDFGQSLDAEYLRSTLRTDSESAAKILRSYYIAQSQGYSGPVDPFLSIWSGRSAQPTDDLIFSRTCLIATACAPSFNQHTHDQQIAEMLLAKHVILPSRNTHHANKAGKEPLQSDLNLENLLQPYAEYVTEHGLTNEGHSLCAPLAARILDVGIRSTSLDSAKKRAVEKSWFEALFTYLAYAANASSGTEPSETGSRILVSLLNVAIRHKLQLSSSILARIARNYTSWSIVSLLMQLGADVYVNSSYRDVSDGLWHAISRDFCAISTELRKDRIYASVKSDVIFPLMRAYASARSLPAFITNWKNELGKCVKLGQGLQMSIWQDTDLTWMLRDVLEMSLDAEQIMSIIQKLLDDAQSDSGNQLELAPLALINSVLSALRSTQVALHQASAISAIRQLCVDALNPAATSDDGSLRTIMWRLYATCHTLESEFAAEDFVQHTKKQELNRIIKFVKDELTNNNGTHLSHTQALETLGIILDNLHRRSMIPSPADCQSSSNGVFCKATQIGTSPGQIINGQLPNQDSTDLNTIHSLLDQKLDPTKKFGWWYDCSSVLLKHPLLLLSDHDKAERQRVLSSIILRGIQQPTVGEDIKISELALNLCRSACNEPLLLEDLRNVLYHKDLSLSGLYQTTEGAKPNPQLLEAIFLGLPANLIPRTLRERAIDAICASIRHVRPKLDIETLVRRLSLATSLLRLPHGGSTASVDLMPITKAIDDAVMDENTDPADFAQLYRLVTEFCASVLGEALEHSEDGKNKTPMKQVLDEFQKKANSSKDKTVITPSLLIVAKEALKLKSYGLDVKPEQWQKLMSKTILRPSGSSDSPRADFMWIEAIADLISATDGDTLLSVQSALKQIGKSNAAESDQFKIVWMLIDLRFGGGSKRSLLLVFDTLESDLNVEEYSILQRNLAKSLKQVKLDHLDEILEQTLLNIGRLGAQSMLEIVFNTPSISLSDNPRIPGIIATLCKQLTLTHDIRSFEHITATINSILLTKSKSLSQYTIETILTSIAFLTSSSSPALPAGQAAHIHSRLNNIMVTLLTVHRRNLRSRFHLLLAPLEGLLRCFFTTDSTTTPKARLKQPSWISQSRLARDNTVTPHGSLALGPERAAALSRLLTLICEPSPSAVRSRPPTSLAAKSNGKASLVDETTAARAYAGKYMGYFVISLCECLLKGRFASTETRDALLQPGIWSVLSVVPKEVLEAQASAGVRGEGRAVLRGLLEEWRRAGGGRNARG